MRIVYLVEGIYPDSGGTPRVVAALSDEMTARGHQVLIVCPSGSRGDNIITAPQLRVPPAQEGALWLTARQLATITEFQPDIIHSHNDRLAIYYGRQLASELSVPHIHTLHADYATLRPHYASAKLLSFIMSKHAKRLASWRHKTSPDRSINWDERDLSTLANFARAVDAAITPAHYIYEQLSPSVKQLKYLPSGHDFSLRSPSNVKVPAKLRPLKLITVSRVVIEKRIDTLIEAIAKVKSPVELTIVGEGNHIDRFRRLADRLGVASSVHFIGKISDRSKLMKAYDQHDAFILGSYHYETQGLVLLEAAARGLPIIYCDERLVVGPTPTNSILTGPTAHELASGIDKFYKLTQKQRHNMALASLAVAKQWPFSKTADDYEQVYRSFTEQPKTQRQSVPSKTEPRTQAQR